MLTDLYITEGMTLVESKKTLPKGVIAVVRGPIGITEQANRNRRVYTNEFWEEILGREEVKQQLESRELVGAADHPDSFQVPIKELSHVLTKSWLDKENNALMGEMEILDTPAGHIIKTALDAKVKIGVSTRALGQMQEKKNVSYPIADTYRWGGVDFVFMPSAQNAYPSEVKEQISGIIESSDIQGHEAYYGRILESFDISLPESEQSTEGQNEDDKETRQNESDTTAQMNAMKERVAILTQQVLERQEAHKSEDATPDEVATLTKEVEAYKRLRKAFEVRVSQLESKLGKVQETNIQLESELESVRGELTSARKVALSEKARLSAQLRLKEDENARLQTTVAHVKESVKILKRGSRVTPEENVVNEKHTTSSKVKKSKIAGFSPIQENITEAPRDSKYNSVVALSANIS